MSVRYHALRPWPDEFFLVDTSEIDRSEFSPTEVTEQFGRVGIIPRAWSIRKVDWYLDILEFVCIRRLRRQKEKVVGPYKYTEEYQAVGKTIHEEEIRRREQSAKCSGECKSEMDKNSKAEAEGSSERLEADKRKEFIDETSECKKAFKQQRSAGSK
ncbi:hypothetical protein R1flu_018998 [Riccia fluitans]|uniref:Uncharacterized protein n=1 Tax=Riccia fluitans TaxID=41844 RepID=A0ABD1ZIW8_9MARC